MFSKILVGLDGSKIAEQVLPYAIEVAQAFKSCLVLFSALPAPCRHQGVATALLQGAIRYARKCGATLLEAYPVDKAEHGRDDWLWHGAKSMYDKAGFAEVARRKPERPVVRLNLA